MMTKINTHQINPALLKGHQAKPVAWPAKQETSFDQVLNETLNKVDLKYSKHADIKMKSLGIVRSKEFEDQLQVATCKARAKNIKEGLILKEDYGFVISVKNNTVITVVNLRNMEDNVFTNIDGAVII